ncbi:hypothetical protein COJ18_27640 [Bacillus cereus]|uniref:hypothetical protein n=1 Tax=Bacillus cereus TaxID=1396 RepID=UPI000BF822B2|nr:hypothetical protein [Bacillus cereus]PFK30595.1 hypothetical protein COJ18_27640 [Bacillus cereus]PFR14225.1 hypothetical protein COK23_28510 [Bacillus cereus]
MDKKWFLSKKEIIYIIVIFVLFPIALNFTLFTTRFPLTYGDGDNWLGFWGNYSGGFMGALVALWIAHRQAKAQREDLENQLTSQYEHDKAQLTSQYEHDKAQLKAQQEYDEKKEGLNRKLRQLPALIFLKYELEKMNEEVNGVWKQKKDIYKSEVTAIQTEKDVTKLNNEELKEIKEAVSRKSYEIKMINEKSYDYISLIDDITIHFQLIKCFNFYKDFSEAISIDVDELQHELNKVFSEYVENQSNNTSIENKSKGTRVKQLIQKTSKIRKEKDKIWKQMESEKMLEELENTLRNLKRELDIVTELKNQGTDA